MNIVKYLPLLVLLISNNLFEIEARGRLMEPVNRGSAFRKNFSTPANPKDDENNCGGRERQYKVNGGKCGVCGDDFALSQPRPNENGGKYGKGVIVQTYETGARIFVDVEITSMKFGFFEFSLCPLKNATDFETEECFDQHKIERFIGGHKYRIINPQKGNILVSLRLPQGLSCDHCVLRWQYTAGLRYPCPDGSARTYCGDQEIFRTCSDIKIE